MFNTDYPPTQGMPIALYQEEWLQPKTVILKMFEDSALPDLVADAEKWIKYAFTTKPVPRKKVLDMKEIYKDVLRLLEVATLLDENQTASPPEGANWMDQRWWLAKTLDDYEPFDYFPRHLTRMEYENPYLVFYKCRRKYTLVEWRQRLQDLWEHCCSSVHMYEFMDHPSIASDYKPLPKLLEAAHLIYVREIAKSKAQKNKVE